MKPTSAQVNELKYILEHSLAPDRLDDHPWASSLVVRQRVQEDASLREKSSGYRLVKSLSALFRQMMPSTPPRQGKRLDTRWCQFGMLAAEYFAPFEYGMAYPSSLRDAWGRMDMSIALFVFGKSAYESAPDAELTRYRLFDDEEEPTATSTLSDWHTKGLERLAELFLTSEQYLSQQLSQPSIVLEPSLASLPEEPAEKLPHHPGGSGLRRLIAPYRRYVRPALLVLALLAVVWLGIKGLRIYQGARAVREDLAQVQSLAAGQLSLDMVEKVGPLLATSRRDVAGLRAETGPFLWIGKGFGWLPIYGGDLASAGEILKMAEGLTAAADQAFQAVSPLLQTLQGRDSHLDMPGITKLLVEAQPELIKAKSNLDEAIASRSRINDQRLSPKLRGLIVDKLDPYLGSFHDGLAFAITFPKLAGASNAGPQTYLLLLQNEDELRPTGGFITAVGAIVVRDGSLLSFKIENSGGLDDFSKPYPLAPWQLDQYMNSHIWVLRDSNWSPDFPTSARLAEYLYAYTHYHSVDGVITANQQVVRSLLTVLGPLYVGDIQVNADNVKSYMRASKFSSELTKSIEPNWHSKDFMRFLAEAILVKLQFGQDIAWDALGKVLLQALDERHILVQLDDPTMTEILADRGWDGAVRPGEGDFLMVVDSNIGFNKVNALVDEKLTYEVDLSNLDAPIGNLTVVHTNKASKDVPCKQWGLSSESSYNNLMNRCYWDYLRVYKSNGTQLVSASPHAIPGEWMILGEDVPARVDMLDLYNGGVNNTQAFGTLLVVPGGTSLETSFQFLLPSNVITSTNSSSIKVYQLRAQKQPGTLNIPLEIRVRLPAGAKILDTNPEAKIGVDGLHFDTALWKDVVIKIVFQMP